MAGDIYAWNGSTWKNPTQDLYTWNGSTWKDVIGVYVWDGSSWQLTYEKVLLTIVSVYGTQISGSEFTVYWSLSGPGTTYKLEVYHVPSGFALTGGIWDPAQNDSQYVFTAASGDLHRLELTDQYDNLIDSKTFTPT